MSYQISPGIQSNEIDNAVVTVAVTSPAAAFAGVYRWGPVMEPTTINSEKALLEQFFKPNNVDNVTRDFHTALNFLSYSDNLLNVRLDTLGNRNAVSKPLIATNDVIKFTVTGGTEKTFTLTTQTTIAEIATAINADVVLNLLVLASEFKGKLILKSVDNTKGVVGSYYAGSTLVSAGVSTPVNGSVAGYVTILPGSSIKVNNDDFYDTNYANGEANVGEFIAKFPGSIGNSIGVIVLDNNTFDYSTLTGSITSVTSSKVVTGSSTLFTKEVFPGSILKSSAGSVIGTVSSVESDTSLTLTLETQTPVASMTNTRVSIAEEYSALFKKPSTTVFASSRNVSNALDEIHILVIDKDGTITGVPGSILEKYSYLSKAADARKEDGTSAYYKSVINSSSSYIRWTDHPTSLGSTGHNWGSRLEDMPADASFKTLVRPINLQFVGGKDDFEVIEANILDAYSLLKNKEQYKFKFLITGKSTSVVAKYAIQSVAEFRRNCVAFISPIDAITDEIIIGNTSSAITKIIEFRDTLPSSSWGVLDSGYKYQYDRFNDKFIWVPLNGDIAGLAARVNEPWDSPAGFSKGQIKNVVKLAVNPNKADRDALYPSGINPVVSFKGQGTVLYGDKTLLSKPSTFDRIGTRMLFIFLEESIEKTAQYTLFELNDEFTRTQFRNAVEPFLKDIKGRRGVYDFKVVCDSTNNTAGTIETNNFVADLYVKPNYSVNFITLNFIATRQSASFSTSG
jgi:hypothetical protein